MSKRVEAFNERYDLLAKHEGWMMSNDSDDRYTIVRVSDPEGWIEDGWPLTYTEEKFEFDDDAVDFVRGMNTAMHCEAIAIHDAHIPLPRIKA